MKKYRIRKLINGLYVAEIYSGFIFKSWKGIAWYGTYPIGAGNYDRFCVGTLSSCYAKLARYGVGEDDVEFID